MASPGQDDRGLGSPPILNPDMGRGRGYGVVNSDLSVQPTRRFQEMARPCWLGAGRGGAERLGEECAGAPTQPWSQRQFPERPAGSSVLRLFRTSGALPAARGEENQAAPPAASESNSPVSAPHVVGAQGASGSRKGLARWMNVN